MLSLSSGLSLCSFVSPTFIHMCNNQPTFVEVKKNVFVQLSALLVVKVKTFFLPSYVHLPFPSVSSIPTMPPFSSSTSLLHLPFSPPLPSLFFCLCDVRYGIADFQTAPVDCSCNGEQSEHHQQRPCNVDPSGVPSWLPCAHLNTWINK